MIRVTVVIPNWNGRHLLGPCLRSLEAQRFRDFAAVIVDNGSADGSAAMLRECFPAVRLIENSENLGFAAAMNAGIAAADGDYVVALNNDTESDPGFLGALVAAMDAAPEAGLATAKLLDFKHRDTIDTIGDGYAFSGLAFKIGARALDRGLPSQPFEVFGACAAAAIYRRRMLAEIGGFDPDFFAYMEDVDLALRARLAGYRCLSVPEAVVYHMGSASTGGGASAFSVRLTARNLVWVIAKNVPPPLLPRMILTAMATQAGAVAQCLVSRRHPWLRRHLGAYGEGLFEAARGLPAMLRKRRALRARRRIGWRELAQAMDAGIAMRRRFAPPGGGGR